MSKLTTCLWFDRGRALEAAEFYASVFPDSRVGEGHASAADNPSAKAGEEIIVEFTVLGQAFIGLNAQELKQQIESHSDSPDIQGWRLEMKANQARALEPIAEAEEHVKLVRFYERLGGALPRLRRITACTAPISRRSCNPGHLS